MKHDAGFVRASLAWLGGGVFVASVIQYVLLFAAARRLGAVEYGVFSAALTASLLAAPLCDLGTTVALVCQGARAPERLWQHFAVALRWRLLAFLPVLGAGLAFGSWAGLGDAFPRLFVPLLLAAVADGVGGLCAAACQVQGRLALAASLQVGRNLLRGVAVLAIVFGDGHAIALADGFAVAAGAAMLFGLSATLRGQRFAVGAGSLATTLREAWPFGSVGFGAVAHGQLAVALLAVHAGADEVGRCHGALRFVLLSMLLPQIVAMALAPVAYRRGAHDAAATARLFRLKLTALGALGTLAAIGLAALGPELVAATLGPGFAGSGPLLQALAPVVFLKFFNSCLGDALSERSRTQRLAVGYWLAAAVQGAAAAWWPATWNALGTIAVVTGGELVLTVFLVVAASATGFVTAAQHVLVRLLAIVAVAAACSLIDPRVAPWGAVLAAAACAWWRPHAEERALAARLLGRTMR